MYKKNGKTLRNRMHCVYLCPSFHLVFWGLLAVSAVMALAAFFISALSLNCFFAAPLPRANKKTPQKQQLLLKRFKAQEACLIV